MKTSSLFLLLGFVSSFSALAQGDAYFVKYNTGVLLHELNPGVTGTEKKEKTKQQSESLVVTEEADNRKNVGSPLFYNAWTEGTFRLSGGQEINGRMALDVSRNIVLYQEIHQNAVIALKPKWVDLYGHKLQRIDDQFRNAGDFYYEQIIDKNYKILKKYTCKYEQYRDELKSGQKHLKADEFDGAYVKDTDYFLVKEKQLHHISNRKKFYRAFNKKENEVKHFVRENKLDLTMQSDVISLVSYLERLEEL
jgi:hypothetical protein